MSSKAISAYTTGGSDHAGADGGSGGPGERGGCRDQGAARVVRWWFRDASGALLLLSADSAGNVRIPRAAGEWQVTAGVVCFDAADSWRNVRPATGGRTDRSHGSNGATGATGPTGATGLPERPVRQVPLPGRLAPPVRQVPLVPRGRPALPVLQGRPVPLAPRVQPGYRRTGATGRWVRRPDRCDGCNWCDGCNRRDRAASTVAWGRPGRLVRLGRLGQQVRPATSTVAGPGGATGATGPTGPTGLAAPTAGATNYVAKFTSTSALGNSQIQDNGNNIGVNIAPRHLPFLCLQPAANRERRRAIVTVWPPHPGFTK